MMYHHMPIDQPSPSCSDAAVDESQHFLYNHGILLPTANSDMYGVMPQLFHHESGAKTEEHPCYFVISAILIFNVALSHHLCAMHHPFCDHRQNQQNADTTRMNRNTMPEPRLRLLLQARELYRMALRSKRCTHQGGQSCSTSSAADEDGVLFQLAIINNLGVIERELGNVTQSKAYFQSLLSVWGASLVVATEMAMDSYATTTDSCMLQNHYLQQFLWNAVRKVDSAAAA